MKRICLCSLLVTLPLVAADLASWQAGQPPVSKGVSLVRGENASWTVVLMGGKSVAAVTPVKDYYKRARVLVRVDKPVPARAWLVVTHFDRGYALIGVAGRGQVVDQWGIARLNTSTFRDAVFEIDNATFEHQLGGGADIELDGLDNVRAIRIVDAAPERVPPPKVECAIKLEGHIDLVMASGADARTLDGLPRAVATIRETLPLVRALGFNGVESYVKWAFVERSPGVFDWSFYDAVIEEMERNGLRWFPLLIVGSAYALPDWIHESKELDGYVCLEHGIQIDIPTIFNDKQVKYVRRFLGEFGKRYSKRKALLGVRLGPSANYGEAQCPAIPMPVSYSAAGSVHAMATSRRSTMHGRPAMPLSTM